MVGAMMSSRTCGRHGGHPSCCSSSQLTGREEGLAFFLLVLLLPVQSSETRLSRTVRAEKGNADERRRDVARNRGTRLQHSRSIRLKATRSGAVAHKPPTSRASSDPHLAGE